MNHDQLVSVLNEHDFTATASELHGLLTGLIAGGMFRESTDYLDHMSELFNNGLTVKGSLKKAAETIVEQVFSQLESEDMSFELYLPDDDESLSDQAEELLNWVQYFLVGFGFNKRDLTMSSNEAREIIEDFTNITRMDTQLDEDNESQADFYEVIEFVRISTVLCHQEFGKAVNQAKPVTNTLH
ncbi:UPF0149 family protein [Psychrosphaera sp. F3M07]|jgi:uncharacterized protein YgfB (UPF0149 family)|uniref:UPF0149 family protein n=1 Tax=Psychrosphaera aquimarina TaxID=2044854 RepID=A0ABU3QWW9_9GAMM|nr:MULTISPECIES: UPF0149 family protein [Psychrosphaera]MBU2918921.1 UPF0149 family protein [Psychrosphaera sp. F3M07]MDU0111910.1 UPF0149 family protein [Psychrosphaera aquimarina]